MRFRHCLFYQGCAKLTRMANPQYEIEALVNEHCEGGENPLWHEDEEKIYWTDIPNGWIFRCDPQTKKHEKIYDGPVVGGFSFQADGKLLLFRDHDIALRRENGDIEILTKKIPKHTGRFNDVIPDPEGRVFAGTMGHEKKNPKTSGGLFRVDLDGSVTQLWDGTGCANGMGFSPDLKKFYWTDSTARKIFVFDYARQSGEISNRELFYEAPDDGSIPDGMSVDADGDIWSAQWDGHEIRHFAPNGKWLDSIRFPVKIVSSCIFGGANLDELFVTTAGGQARRGKNVERSTPDGTLYRVAMPVRGQKRFRSRIGL
jgi:D-xylonolactonase